MKRHRNQKQIALRISVLAIMLSLLIAAFMAGGSGSVAAAESVVKLFRGEIDTNRDSFFDSSVVQKLPDTVKETDEISLIVQVNEDSILDRYEASDAVLTLSEFAFSEAGNAVRERIAAEKRELLASLDEAKISYTAGANYTTLLSGFELTITARDFESVCKVFGKRANTYVAEAYKRAETELVENKVDVYETGIFDSSDVPYDGTGTVVAILDTGLDYTHTAFSTKNFTADRSKLGLTFDEVASLIASTRASELRDGLTASDVYISEKVPFGFDYADADPDVYPVDSDHGTHVAGIIAGKDDRITGVAPNAQLAIMKTFSDVKDSAIASWILSALEDCVVLGVDVINMSLGTSCGFARETDEEMMSGVYDRIRERGISLVVAASNAYISTYGSEKNGNLGLTSNPDSATVGSPSTYKGAISIASVSGVKTPYILYGDKIIYFNESTDRIAEEKHFVEELLPAGTDSLEIEFVTIPGAGRSADYTGIDVAGKIALIARGATTFEEKANIAQNKGAAGVIIYNNVSGDIKMNVGDTTIPVCSISQDDGEMLAALGTAKIKIDRSQTSGPFMSDFSSWGPSPSLEIKPELTAHGGSILSAVPGQSYDRISGTSMATPNISGVSALLRQYVV
ncbi:MAG: S8 family serine peptidase, partial [Clostridia bacterium]|nr:S8 family serine peptidase [Clostridia bacterium]